MQLQHRSKTVVILAFYFPPDGLAGGARPYRFFKYLPRFGYQTRVVTVAPQPDNGVSHVRYVPHPRQQGEVQWFTERLVRRFIAPTDDGISWYRAAAASAEPWIKEGASIVLSTSPAISTHLAAMRLKRRYGVKWIADFRDPMLGNPYRTESRRFDTFMEPRIFRQADALIANTDALEKAWIERYPQHRDKISLLWNGFDPEEQYGPAPLPVRGYRLLTHTGDIYGARHPGPLVSSVKRLIDRGQLDTRNIKINLVGRFFPEWSPAQASDMESLRNIGCMMCTGEPVPKEDAQRELAESDYLLLLDVSGPRAGLQVPSKIFEYLRIGRPVLTFTNRNSPVDRIMERSEIPGVSVYEADDDAAVDAKMMEFLALSPEPVRASDWFWDQFDGLNQARQLAKWLDELTREE